jgi:hypothetical protein
VPGAGEGVAVLAERASVIRRRPLLTGPDRKGVPFQLVDVVEGVTRVAVEAALYLLARLCPEQPLVPDDLDALDPLSLPLPEVDALDEEEVALHPLEGDAPFYVPGHLPGADQPVQALEVGARLGRLLVSLGLVGVVHYNGSSFRRFAIVCLEHTVVILKSN